jgi:hypothetical protein
LRVGCPAEAREDGAGIGWGVRVAVPRTEIVRLETHLGGRGNTKSGDKYLAWAYVEAASFAVRYNATIKRYYQRTRAETIGVVAIETVAHKLARAC